MRGLHAVRAVYNLADNELLAAAYVAEALGTRTRFRILDYGDPYQRRLQYREYERWTTVAPDNLVRWAENQRERNRRHENAGQRIVLNHDTMRARFLEPVSANTA